MRQHQKQGQHKTQKANTRAYASLCLTYDFLAVENPEHGLPDLGYF